MISGLEVGDHNLNFGLTASGLMPSTIVDDRIRGFRTYIVQIHYEKGQKEMKTFVLYVLIAS